MFASESRNGIKREENMLWTSILCLDITERINVSLLMGEIRCRHHFVSMRQSELIMVERLMIYSLTAPITMQEAMSLMLWSKSTINSLDSKIK